MKKEFLANAKLREECQYCQKGISHFFKATLRLSHELTDAPLLIWMDSRNDAKENLRILLDGKDWFIMKRNPRGSGKKSERLVRSRNAVKMPVILEMGKLFMLDFGLS